MPAATVMVASCGRVNPCFSMGAKIGINHLWLLFILENVDTLAPNPSYDEKIPDCVPFSLCTVRHRPGPGLQPIPAPAERQDRRDKHVRQKGSAQREAGL